MTINVVINSWIPFTYQLPEVTRFAGLVHVVLPPFEKDGVIATTLKFIIPKEHALDVKGMDEWLTTQKDDFYDFWNGMKQTREMAKAIPDYLSSARSL